MMVHQIQIKVPESKTYNCDSSTKYGKLLMGFEVVFQGLRF